MPVNRVSGAIITSISADGLYIKLMILLRSHPNWRATYTLLHPKKSPAKCGASKAVRIDLVKPLLGRGFMGLS
jgi:hypothetical protein